MRAIGSKVEFGRRLIVARTKDALFYQCAQGKPASPAPKYGTGAGSESWYATVECKLLAPVSYGYCEKFGLRDDTHRMEVYMEHLLVVRPDGTVDFIYDDGLQPLLEAGDGLIRRASHVEPTEDGRWLADLGPVGGPCLGPFRLRAEALAAEVEYLRSHYWNSFVAGNVQAASEMDPAPI